MEFEELATDLAEITPSQKKKEKEVEVDNEDKNAGRTVKVKETINQHAMRRVVSELNLEKELSWHFEKGVTYHCISWGDVDSLTYFRAIVKQQKIKFALLSTWVMASEDIAEIKSWIEKGYIKRVDFYIGEIFKNSYRKQYDELIALCKELGGRVCMFRNHSKVMVLLGEKFDAVIEGSANVNHNPRTEQCAITIDSDLALWYKNFFDETISFERDFDNVKPMVI